MRARPCTYVLWDLDEGEGILGGLCWQVPGAEGRGDGSQTGGRHNFSLRRGKKERNQTQCGAFFKTVGAMLDPHNRTQAHSGICFSLRL